MRHVLETGTDIVAVDFSSDSKFLALLCGNGEVAIWDVLLGEAISRTQLQQGAQGPLDLGTERRFAVLLETGVEVWDTRRGREVVFPGPPDSIPFVLMDRQAQVLAIPHMDGRITLHSIGTPSTLRTVAPAPAGERVRLLPGGDFEVVYLLGSGKVRILGLDPGGQETTLEFPRHSEGPVCLSRDRGTLASVSPGGAIEIRSVPGGTVRSRLPELAPAPAAMALSPDGSLLALPASNGIVELWDTNTGERLDQFETSIWPDRGITFSPDGHLLAWIEEGRKKVRFWSPAQGVISWRQETPYLSREARSVCRDLASIVRFRKARQPFEKGRQHLEADELFQARDAFAEARKIFPEYPGLAAASDEAEERYHARMRAEELRSELEELEGKGDYYAALGAVETFLRDYPDHDDQHLQGRAGRIRGMLQHLELAEGHRKGGRSLDALVEFDRAVAVLPEVEKHHPDYVELRRRFTEDLEVRVNTAVEKKDPEEVLKLYGDIERLRSLDHQALLRCGVAHEELGHRKRALEAYESIPEGIPEYAEARWRLGKMARRNGDLKLARAEFEKGRGAAPSQSALETDYAEVCELLGDLDAAVAAWRRVGELGHEDPLAFENIGRLEEKRERWEDAGKAYHDAIRRSGAPRPELLLKMVEVYGRAGMREKILEAYLGLLDLVGKEVDVPELGDRPERKVRRWIRELGYVRHRGEWIPREQFLAEQGWVRHGKEWVRPEEAHLMEIAERTEKEGRGDLRVLPEERYRSEAKARRILKGMNRREVIQVWGFFKDQNVFKPDGRKDTVYEQLLFADGRQVYLRNGFVCFWSE